MSFVPTEPYLAQTARWPATGRHVLAHYDDDSVVVYQAYRPAIGRYAAKHGHFGGDFSLARMSWIKPNFLWMMYRCGWATKVDQEVVLAITLQRAAFDAILATAVPSSYAAQRYADEAGWRAAVLARGRRFAALRDRIRAIRLRHCVFTAQRAAEMPCAPHGAEQRDESRARRRDPPLEAAPRL